jgi:HTH-type transcriptional regulator/antitoxin MqsA
MTIKCPICRSAELELVTVTRESAAADGTLVEYAEELLECTKCGERFRTHEQALVSGRNRAAALRRHEHLLTPADIRDIRRRFALSQADLEGLLGVGAKTVVRWERGTVCQSRAVDALLRILEYFGPAVFDCVKEGRVNSEGGEAPPSTASKAR